MHKVFSSLEDLFSHIKEDKEWAGANAAHYNRYPVRFILFDNFADFNEFINERPDGIYKHSIDTLLNESWPDTFISNTELSKAVRSFVNKIPVNDYVIYPFSEMARFYDNIENTEFDAVVKTIGATQAPEDAQTQHVRIYIPIVGMQGKMNRFMNDNNTFVWEYKSGKDQDNYRLIMTDGTTYGIDNLEAKYSVVNDLKEWLLLWKQGTNVKPTIISKSPNIFKNAHHAQPDNAFSYVKCKNAYQFLTMGLGLDFGVSEEPSAEELPYWEKLASMIDIENFNFEDFVKERLDTFNLNNGVDFIKSWFDCETDFDRWLLTIYFRKISKGNGYINRAVAQCTGLSKSELFSNIATLIFSETNKENSIQERNIALAMAAKHGVKITDEARRKLKAKLGAMAVNPDLGGYYLASKLLTPLTNEEFQFAIEWLAKKQIQPNEIKDIFPNLYYYLQPLSLNSLSNDNMWVAVYMDAYRESKIANTTLPQLSDILEQKNNSITSFYNWMGNFKTVKTILHKRKDIDMIYWIDGLGIDWIPLIREIIRKYGKESVYLNEIHIAVADLPTVTSNNKEKLQALLPVGVKLPKIGDLDSFAHSSKSYPQYIIDEILIVEKAIKKVLDEYNGRKIAFVSDHGLTYLAQFEKGLKLAGITTNHEGRVGEITDNSFSSDNNLIILEDGKTICSLSHQSLTHKTDMGHGAHGGCTPEEVLVPIIVVSSHKNADTYSIKIENEEIDGTNPKVRFIIKGLNSIDVPTLRYNGVSYHLINVGGNIYESERLALSDAATKVTVRINEKNYDKFNIKVSTGASEEEDLFEF